MSDSLESRSVASGSRSSQNTQNNPLEAELSQAFHQQILESSDDCIKILDLEGRILFMNQRGQALLGIEEIAPFLNTFWIEFWQGADRQTAIEAIAKAKTGEVYAFQGYLPTLNGEPKWWDTKISPIRSDGRVEGLLCISRDITDRVRVEAERKQAEEQLAAIFSKAAVGLSELSLDRQFLRVNDELCRILGRSRSQLFETSVIDLTHPAHVFESLEAFQRLVETGEPVSFDKRYLRPDKTSIWANVSLTRLDDEQGNPRAVLAVTTDLSDRKQTETSLQNTLEELQVIEEELREQNEELVAAREQAELERHRYQDLFDFAPDGYVVTDKRGIILEANQAIANLVATNQRYLIKTPLSVYIAKPDRRAFRCLLAELHQSSEVEKLQTDELRVRYIGEQWIPVAITGTPIRDAQMQTVGVRWFIQDITDRKAAEAALRESESRFRMMVESAKDYAIFTLDLDGNVTSWNSGAERVLQYSEAEILGCSGRIVFTAEDKQQGRPEQEMRLALTQGRAENERWHLRKDGSRFWGSGLMMPLQDEAGNVQGFVNILQDKTDQRQTEAQREQLLQREQAARQEAEQANRIKDEFLAVLSHELRSPLNPILGWSKLLQQGKLDAARTQAALKTIERNANLQSELIEDLLDVSRILQGKLRLNVSSINLASIIQAAIETVRLAAEAKSIQIEAMLEAEVDRVSGDSTRLQQVVWNLLSNAVKFTPAGGRVSVRLEQVENQAHIIIRDNGRGIQPEFVPYVFDYFRQEDGATTRKFGGLGLGLAIVRHLVELHGGTVEATSEGEGRGATFTVKLPLMLVQPEMDLVQPETEALPDLNGVRVLVIDDDTDSREFVAFVLEQSGAQVTTAPSAGEGFLALMQSPPDVLLSDIGMPEMDGYMLMQQIRSLSPEQGGTVSAIALTAYAGDFNQRQALEAGFQQHLSKPIEPEALVKTIRGLLKEA